MAARPFKIGCSLGFGLGVAALLPLCILGVQISDGTRLYDKVNAPAFWLGEKFIFSGLVEPTIYTSLLIWAVLIFAQWFILGFGSGFLLGLRSVRKSHAKNAPAA